MASEQVSFELHIQELFSERDQEAMLIMFDLWKVEDVREHSEAILEQLASGRMPCDGAWPEEQVALFRRWIEGGMLP
jgi:hypothetical protein